MSEKLNFLIECRRDHVELYNSISGEFRKYHLWLNSGGATVVAAFFSSQAIKVDPLVEYACLCFIIGTITSAASYVWEFLIFYCNLNYFDDNFLPREKDSNETISEKVDAYIKYQERKKKSNKNSVFCRVIFGLFCYFLFVLGVFFLSLNLLLM